MAQVRKTQRTAHRAPHRADIVVIAYFVHMDGTRIKMRSNVNPADIKPACAYRGIVRLASH